MFSAAFRNSVRGYHHRAYRGMGGNPSIHIYKRGGWIKPLLIVGGIFMLCNHFREKKMREFYLEHGYYPTRQEMRERACGHHKVHGQDHQIRGEFDQNRQQRRDWDREYQQRPEHQQRLDYQQKPEYQQRPFYDQRPDFQRQPDAFGEDARRDFERQLRREEQQ